MDHLRVTRANNHGCNGIATTTMVNGQGRLVVAMVDNNCQCRLKQDNACDKFAISSYDVNPISQRSMRGGSHIPCSLEPLLVEHGSQRQLALSVMLWCIFQLDRDSHRRRRDASTLSGDEIAGRHTCNHVHPKRIPRPSSLAEQCCFDVLVAGLPIQLHHVIAHVLVGVRHGVRKS